MNKEDIKDLTKELEKAKCAIVVTDAITFIKAKKSEVMALLSGVANSMYENNLSIEEIRKMFNTSLDAFEEYIENEKKSNKKKKSMFSEREEENEEHLTILEDFAEFLKKLLGED